ILRDIKPANVMLRADGAVKLLDFGLAAQIHTSLSRVSRVRYGTSGTGPYMAPEQWRGQQQDAATDQYSLAVLAYELLAGRLPFESVDPAVLREAVLNEPPPPIPGLDGRTWKALCKALAKERAARYASCGEFVAALSGLAGKRGARRRSDFGYWVLGIGAAAVLAFAALSFTADWRGPQTRRVTLKEQTEPNAGDTQTVDLGGGVKLEMDWCPPGTFMMGSPSGEAGRWYDDTQHRVTLTKGFWMGKYEVTQAQWEAVMGSNPSYFKNAGRSAPVEQVSWDDCQEFVRKLNVRVPGGGFRLPTEAEWEYACRAVTSTVFQYDNDLDASMANFNGNYRYGNGRKGEYRLKTLPVGSFRPNVWGLYDMHGNVWEWCQDWHGEYPSGSVTDPAGPGSGSNRVYRGGGWYCFARGCRSACRSRGDPGDRVIYLGLRLARSPQ
ncbi:MAG: SUMF1/EgtB/PvdO family nonheme iron enzyme, partial [Lentisphaerae bacterium]|nr:SUMF1/EgtB/PvdO family nonheme iron enzyme [Lentisphaerota bacterium]